MGEQNHNDLWNRWLALASLPKEDVATLINSLHQEVRAGCELIGKAAHEEMKKIVRDTSFTEKDAYLNYASTINVGAAYSGYLIFLIVNTIDPTSTSLKARSSTERLGSVWVEGYEKDEHKTIIETMNPWTLHILRQATDIKIDQQLALCPSVVNQPYRITERLNEYIKWSVYQGYVLGYLEKSLSSPN